MGDEREISFSLKDDFQKSGRFSAFWLMFYGMIKSFFALSMACVRRATPSLSKRFREWVFMVLNET